MGPELGVDVGDALGFNDGWLEGAVEGFILGVDVGELLGFIDGRSEKDALGFNDGDLEG